MTAALVSCAIDLRMEAGTHARSLNSRSSTCLAAEDDFIPLHDLVNPEPKAATVLPSSTSWHTNAESESVPSLWPSFKSNQSSFTLVNPSILSFARSSQDGTSLIKRYLRSFWCRKPQPWPRHTRSEDDLEATAQFPIQTLGHYGTCSQHDFGDQGSCEKPALITPSLTSIYLTFDFGYKTYFYTLDFGIFRLWKHMELLVHALHTDGVACALIWDELESMRICAGDWDARARPGWQVRVYCNDADDMYEDGESDEEEEESDEGTISIQKSDKSWWFDKWKMKTERHRESKNTRRGWIVGLVGFSSIAVVFWLLICLSHEPKTEILV